MPNVRDHDASVYLRLQGDALSVGGYESNPIFWEEVSAAGRFSGGTRQVSREGRRSGHSSAPTSCRYQPPVAGGESSGEHLPFGAVCGTDLQCRGNGRDRGCCAHPSILNSHFGFVCVVQENPKNPRDSMQPRFIFSEAARDEKVSHHQPYSILWPDSCFPPLGI